LREQSTPTGSAPRSWLGALRPVRTRSAPQPALTCADAVQDHDRGDLAHVRRTRTTLALAATAVAVLGSVAQAADTTTVVTGADISHTYTAPSATADKQACITQTETWCLWQRDGGSAQFVDPAGNHQGYLQMNTPGSNDKVNLINFNVLRGKPVSALTSLSYKTLLDMPSTATPAAVPAINVVVDMNGGGETLGTERGVLVWEPVYAAGGAAGVVEDVWQSWTPTTGSGWWAAEASAGSITNYSSTWADVLASPALADATIVGVGVNTGGGNTGLVAGADALKVNDVTYDFERDMPLPPKLTPTTAEQCKKGAWTAFNAPVFKNQGDCVSFTVAKG